MDQVARIGGSLASRSDEIAVGLEATVGGSSQDQFDGAIVPSGAGLSTEHVQRSLDLERKIRGLFRAVFHFDSILETALQIALADPVVPLRKDVVGGNPPHQGHVLVEETRMDLGLRVQRDVADEEREVGVVPGVRQIIRGVEEPHLVLGLVAPGQQARRVPPGPSGGSDPGALFDELPELALDLARRHVGGDDPGHDLRVERHGPSE